MSLYPSYWRDTACGSHFIIWNNNINWCSGWETEGSDSWSVSHDLEETVLNNLNADHYTKCYDLAEKLDLIRPFEAEGHVASWHDRLILPGQKWGKKIDAKLRSADFTMHNHG